MGNSYTKLRDGSWGVRVENETVQPGAVVNVTKREDVERLLPYVDDEPGDEP